MVRRYRARAPIRPAGLAIVAAAALAAAAITAALGNAVAHVAPLAGVLPAFEGAAVGIACAAAVRARHVGHPRAVSAVAIAGAMLALIGHAYLDYRDYTVQRRVQMGALHDSLGVTGVDVVPADHPQLAPMSFFAFVGRRVGVTAGSGHPIYGDRSATVGRPVAMGLAALELILALGLAMAFARAPATEPTCPRCGRWRQQRPLGVVALGCAEPLERELGRGDADAAADGLFAPDTREQTRLSVLACPEGHDGDGGVLRIADYRIPRGGRLWARSHGSIQRGLQRGRTIDLEVDGGALAAIRDRVEIIGPEDSTAAAGEGQ